ncbi:MAG: LysM peptidoglycan-binding domain-containing protein [Verrucomicrobiia bacterium]|tara:strand:- start:7775 stop:8752 length:978 start_codon:yes stop_codon:yes gene_type:complete
MLSAAGGTHTVRRGDTLGAIAKKYGTSISALKSANGLNSDTIIVGQKLTLTGSAAAAIHVVAKGESLSTIARKYGTSVRSIKSENDLKSDLIKVGQRLKIPGKSKVSDPAIHIVRKGETLSLIAQTYGTRVNTIKEANNLRSDRINVGQKLNIPSGGSRSIIAGGSSLLAPVIAATNRLRVDSSRWRYIVCHHSAIEAGNAEAYGRAHKRRGMENGLAYHFVIGNGRDSGDGEIEIGPRWKKQLQGGHVRSDKVNESGIGICIVGNLQNHRPSTKQRQAMNELIGFLKDGYSRSNAEVTVHKLVDKNHTVCPGKYFPYDDLKHFA